eukprot:TRINITY_DN4571_c0_g1_i1.p1 TRINITY_DN4571_c0_g1~~TRINITY_DN4571_c0_g1_i1.p1  ORF type:complete len:713 (-),score=169.29 TRINITY_DN4571_c0_g1_i1:157-2295(-)
MGYRVSMRVLDPGPTGSEGVVLATQRRTPAGALMQAPSAALKYDQFTSSYAASFAKKPNPLDKPNPMGLTARSRSFSQLQALSPAGGRTPGGGFAKSTSLPRLVEEDTRQPVTPPPQVVVAQQPPREEKRPSKGPNASQQRALLELLGNPELEKAAKKIFKSYDHEHQGSLSFKAMERVLVDLDKKLGIGTFDERQVHSMFKKYDVRCDNALDFAEFFDLLLALLRKNAFSRDGHVVNREFFVTKNPGKVWDEWDKVKKLGAGSFGTAYLAKNRYGEERVVKAVKKSRVKIPVEDVEREIMVMRQVDHPHVVRLFGWYEDKRQIFLIMEALKGGTLQEAVLQFQSERKGLREEWIREVMKQVISALAYCHSLRLIHKDIKDENIMLLKKSTKDDKPYAMVIDLGIAEMFTSADPQGRECGGTPLTMAPEVWTGNFGPKCDVWSLGCVLYELFTGSFPFMANSMNSQAWIRLHRRGPDWSLAKMSIPGTALCKEMLSFQEDRRPTMSGCLMHEWFSAGKCELRTVTPAQLHNLQAYCKDSLMKRTMLLEIASKLPMDQAKEVVEMFETADANSDGYVSKKELGDFLRSLGLNEPHLPDLIFKAMDVDSSGELSFTEFSAGILPLFKDLLEDRVGAWINEYDDDHDGKVDREHATKMMEGVSKAMGRTGNFVGEEMMRDGRDMRISDFRDQIMGSCMKINTPSSRAPSTRMSRR